VSDESLQTPDVRPPYLHIADVLRGEIDDGRYRVGERIPSQAELEGRFDVSRPTVQRALKELRREGYIDNQRGRSAEVLPRHARGNASGPDEPGRAFVALDTHIAAAFERQDVMIDSFSLTAETLISALALPLQRIKLGELRPASLSLRVLLPSLDTNLTIPQLVGDPTDQRPLRRLRQLVRGHVTTLRSTFNGLSVIIPELRPSVEFRSLPVTPLVKLYLLNHDTALHGFYRVVPRVVTLGGGAEGGLEEGEIYDVLGISATLFPYHRDPEDSTSFDSLFVQDARDWFESLWTNIASPLTLIE
jgi:hypothetical protein